MSDRDHSPLQNQQSGEEALMTAVSREVAEGWRTVSMNQRQVVLEKGKKTSHGLHLVLTIVTGGAWVIVWGVMVFVNRRQSKVLTVDSFGNLNRS